ncbi:MAG: phospho-sugar mutase, partial [Spirochaetota bacterium]
GLAAYIKKKQNAHSGVVISYDSRRMSLEFARCAASVLGGNDIPVYIFDELTPTPLCSFAIRELRAAAGIMITASHNPPEYNGYKVFSADGGQIVPPEDGEIIDEIRRISSADLVVSSGYEKLKSGGVITVIGDVIRTAYISRMKDHMFSGTGKKEITVTYSALHGTGYRVIPEVLASTGFSSLHLVPEQSTPDGNFPTVQYPNPEERNAMSLAIRNAVSNHADIVLATDPDADRIGVGVRSSGGEYVLLNGNQTAVLLADYILNRKKSDGTLPQDGYIVKTIITTELLERIAESYDVRCESVLTGFKWIASLMKSNEKEGRGSFLFGCEESYGYLPVDFIRDKDAVSTACFICEMADFYKKSGITLLDRIDALYKKHGMFLEDMHYIVLEGASGAGRIRRIMNEFRQNPEKEIENLSVSVICDYSTLEAYDVSSATRKSIDGIPQSNVMQYRLKDGSLFSIRPSGTEPKIKFYISCVSEVQDDDLRGTEERLVIRIARIKDYINKRIGSIE